VRALSTGAEVPDIQYQMYVKARRRCATAMLAWVEKRTETSRLDFLRSLELYERTCLRLGVRVDLTEDGP
jgi:hypothetical protein